MHDQHTFYCSPSSFIKYQTEGYRDRKLQNPFSEPLQHIIYYFKFIGKNCQKHQDWIEVVWKKEKGVSRKAYISEITNKIHFLNVNVSP